MKLNKRLIQIGDDLHEKALKDSLDKLGDTNFSAWVRFLIKNYKR